MSNEMKLTTHANMKNSLIVTAVIGQRLHYRYIKYSWNDQFGDVLHFCMAPIISRLRRKRST